MSYIFTSQGLGFLIHECRATAAKPCKATADSKKNVCEGLGTESPWEASTHLAFCLFLGCEEQTSLLKAELCQQGPQSTHPQATRQSLLTLVIGKPSTPDTPLSKSRLVPYSANYRQAWREEKLLWDARLKADTSLLSALCLALRAAV